MLQRTKSTEVQTSSLLVPICMIVALNATKSLTLDATKYVIMTDVTARLNLATNSSFRSFVRVSSAFCWYLSLAFKGLTALARAVLDTHTHTHTHTQRRTQWVVEPHSCVGDLITQQMFFLECCFTTSTP